MGTERHSIYYVIAKCDQCGWQELTNGPLGENWRTVTTFYNEDEYDSHLFHSEECARLFGAGYFARKYNDVE
jgi:hypothetical protein